MSPRTREGLVILTLVAATMAGIATISSRSNSATMLRVRENGESSQHNPYAVNLSPAGEVRFARIPQRVVTLDANYNDMLVAVRQEQKLVATGYRDNFFDGFYKQLPGVKVLLEPSALLYLAAPGGGMFDKETLYALGADVHHIDPVQLASSRGWSRSDVEEIARNVGPFVANRYSRDNNYSGSEPYSYYTLWELSQKVAEVYRRPRPMQQLREVYEGMLAAIRAKLPPVEKRPRIGLVYYNRGQFTTYSLMHDGFGQAQYRDLQAHDAFASIESSTYGGGGSTGIGTPLDAEGLLALNPDILIMPFTWRPPDGTGWSPNGRSRPYACGHPFLGADQRPRPVSGRGRRWVS